MPMNSPLTSLPRNSVATINRIEATPDQDRLKSMGFVPGTKIQVTQTGRTLLVKLTGTTFGVSSELAKSIIVSSEN